VGVAAHPPACCRSRPDAFVVVSAPANVEALFVVSSLAEQGS
jgi:hypothetical protein